MWARGRKFSIVGFNTSVILLVYLLLNFFYKITGSLEASQ